MSTINLQIDRAVLNRLLGIAFINDDFCKALLGKETRVHILDNYHLSHHTREFLISLSDSPRIEDFAECIYDALNDENNDEQRCEPDC